MIDVALLDVRPVNPPLEPKERLIVASFAVEIGGVTVRRCLLMEERNRRWVLTPRCRHEDAGVRFSPALNRYLTRIVRREIEARTQTLDASPGGPSRRLSSASSGPAGASEVRSSPDLRARAREEDQ